VRSTHCQFVDAINGLRSCFYKLKKEDENGVINALKAGTMNGAAHNQEKIDSLRSSLKWLNRCGPCMRKEFNSGEVALSNLSLWWNNNKVTASAGQPAGKGVLDDGKPLFMLGAKNASDNLKLHTQHMHVDIDCGCRATPPTRGSKHGLTKCVSLQGESSLENYHGILVHFANMGMRTELADALNTELEGHCPAQ